MSRESTLKPLCVDLDSTLIRTDTLQEQVVRIAQRSPGRLLAFPWLLLSGRAKFKQRIAQWCPLDPAALPYRDELVAYLRSERAGGRRLVLATAADAVTARGVADHLGVFDEVLASDGERNLKGPAKAQTLADRFGDGGFVYAGDSTADMPVWRRAGGAVLVGVPRELRRRVEAAHVHVEAVFEERGRRLRSLARALRPHQWVKNILVFAPVILAHDFTAASLGRCALMFLAFCAAASGIYVCNDVLDLDSDRRHPRKRRRPFASGALPLRYGIASPLLVLLGLAIATCLGAASVATLFLYIVATTAYSVKLKSYPLIDVFLLAALYTVRLYAGGVATGTPVSTWLLGFSSFLFLSLALVKRFGELTASQRADGSINSGRGYLTGDVAVLQTMGVSAAFTAALVLSLYVDSSIAVGLYRAPRLLWLVVPLLLFLQCRIWLAAARGHMTDDPIVYAVKDWVTWVAVGLTAVVYAAALLGTSGP